MKANAISKINKLGKAGKIISTILKVLIIIAIVAVVVALILSFILPRDFLSIQVHADADVEVNYGSVGMDLSKKNETELNDFLEEEGLEGNFSINGFEFEMEQFEFNDDSVIIQARADVNQFDVVSLRIILIGALLHLALVLVLLHFVQRFSKSLSACETPFCNDVILPLQHLTWAILPTFLLSSTFKSLVESAFTGNWNIGIQIDMTGILIVLFLFALAYIFKYGAQLQQESDETL